jgi:hypothetical protein
MVSPHMWTRIGTLVFFLFTFVQTRLVPSKGELAVRIT